MVLINVIEDMSMPVVGLERRAYMCSACGITEQRTAINKQAKEKHDVEISAILNPRPIVPPVSGNMLNALPRTTLLFCPARCFVCATPGSAL
jgi:hypothetical protein